MRRTINIPMESMKIISELEVNDVGTLFGDIIEYGANSVIPKYNDKKLDALFSFLKISVDEVNKDFEMFVYYIMFSNNKEKFIKIGISNDPEKRAKGIAGSNYKFKILKTIQYKCRESACEKEKFEHEKYKEYKYIPITEFAGFTECFKSDILITK